MEQDKKITIASPPARLIAFLIDFIFLMLLTRFVFVPLFLPLHWDILSVKQVFLELTPAYLCAMCLFLFKDILFGRSIGKYLSHIKIVQLDETFSHPLFFMLIKRNFSLFLFPFEIYKLMCDPYCRRYGDKIAKTIVIKAESEIKIRTITTKVIFVILIICVLWSFYVYFTPKQIERTHLYQFVLEEIQSKNLLSQEMGQLVKVDNITHYEVLNQTHQLSLEVNGSKKSGNLSIELTKINNKYTIHDLNFQTKSQ